MLQSNCCRLCINICNDYKNLFDEQGQPTEAHRLVSKYFTPEMLNLECDQEISHLCMQCWQHLKEFQDFQQSVLLAQKIMFDKEPVVSTCRAKIPDDNIIDFDDDDDSNITDSQDHTNLTYGTNLFLNSDLKQVEKVTLDIEILKNSEPEILDKTLGDPVKSSSYAKIQSDKKFKKSCHRLTELHNEVSVSKRTELDLNLKEYYHDQYGPSTSKTKCQNKELETIISLSDNSDEDINPHHDDGVLVKSEHKRKVNVPLKPGDSQNPAGNFSCTLCSNTYMFQTGLFWHMKKRHSKDWIKKKPGKQCIHCKAVYDNPSDLINHINNKHKGHILNTCKFCSRSYLHRNSLDRHINLHHPREAKLALQLKGS